jgi:DNA-binding NarL/FixJ family response regulator
MKLRADPAATAYGTRFTRELMLAAAAKIREGEALLVVCDMLGCNVGTLYSEGQRHGVNIQHAVIDKHVKRSKARRASPAEAQAKPNMAVKVTPELRAQILAMRGKSVTFRKIAEQLGLNPNTVKYVVSTATTQSGEAWDGEIDTPGYVIAKMAAGFKRMERTK